MKKQLHKRVLLLALLQLVCLSAFAQTTIRGQVTDATTREPLIGVNIQVKGLVTGTVTDNRGNFMLTIRQDPPFTLLFSIVGYDGKEVQVQEGGEASLNVTLQERTLMGREVVVSASRMEESIMESPVTVEKMDVIALQQAAPASFYDAIANLKGVHVNSGSLNFPSYNTRGFATIANERFVQLVDGMDNSAPLLNFPTGNLTGLSELDVESVELVPGAASALYGPNAFNGILFMNSKSPFEYQGLSIQSKIGATHSDNAGTNPLYDFSVRYAKAFNNRFAFKVNFSFFDAEDWRGTNYHTDRVDARNRRPASNGVPQSPNFDGVNLYGDEVRIALPLGPLGTLDLRRTGLPEEDLIDDFQARSRKADVALHYRINSKIEAIASYRYGGGSTLYQGGEKYALRDFSQQFLKAELRGDNFFVRAYRSATDAGNSYNVSALGAFANERLRPTRPTGDPANPSWAERYGQNYVLAIQGYIPNVPAGNPEAAHAWARSQADAGMPARGSAAYNEAISTTREALFQRENGARLVDNSKLYHAEFNYNFKNQIKFVEIQVGGNVRRYDLFSDGTVFNENPETTAGGGGGITIDEFGVYTQLSKKLLADRLKLNGSIRYDKNENFNGQFTPRLSAVYTLLENQHLRASFQTGFRNPQTQAQFIWFPASEGILLGSTRANAERYGIHNGGALNSRGEVVNLRYVQPERLVAYEVGYKGLLGKSILLDVNYYFNRYRDFLSQQTVFSREATSHQGNPLPAGTAFRPYVNADEIIRSHGVGVGLTYNLPRGFMLSGNYSYATFSMDKAEGSEFEPAFNTPEHRYTVNFGNRKLFNNFGFNVGFRWQDSYLWQSSFGQAMIGSFGVLDAQVNYRIPALKTIVKVGGTNLAGHNYVTNLGAAQVGSTFYISLTFDEMFNR
jgi:iron complex outermembrane recepter protein